MNWEVFWSVLAALAAMWFIVVMILQGSYDRALSQADAKLRVVLADFSDYNESRLPLLKIEQDIADRKLKFGADITEAARANLQLEQQKIVVSRLEKRWKFTREDYLFDVIQKQQELEWEYERELSKELEKRH